MANERRLRQNFLNGFIGAVDATATTLIHTSLANLPVIGTLDHILLTLDSGGVGGSPEIVQVTAHAASATSATVVRGREGTTARAHGVGTPWAHTPLVSDLGFFFSPPDGNTPPSAYPAGLSRGNTASGGVGWPAAASWSQHVTVNQNGDITQMLYGVVNDTVHRRRANTGNDTWSAWVRLDNFLPLTGGTLTGDIVSNSKIQGAYWYSHSGITSTIRKDTAALNWGDAVVSIENATSSPRIAFHQPGKVASSFGQWANSEEFRTFDNGGGWFRNISGLLFYSANVQVSRAIRGQYTGNGTNDRHIGLGFQPKHVIIFNHNWGYFHEAFHTVDMSARTEGRYHTTNGNMITTVDQGYRPWLRYDGFYVNASLLNNNGTLYDYYAWG